MRVQSHKTDHPQLQMPIQSPGCYLWLASMIPSSPQSPEALSLGFYGGFIMSARFVKSLIIGDWTESLAPLPSLKIGEGRTERSKTSSHLIGTNSPILRTFQKYLINIFRCDWQGLVMNSKQHSDLLPCSKVPHPLALSASSPGWGLE